MNTSKFPGDILKDSQQNSSGFYGTKRISGTSAVTGHFMGFFAREDTVIATLTNDTHDVGTVTGYAGLTVLAGHEIFFGIPVTSITLTSGSGDAYNSEPVVLPAAPILYGCSTSTDGTEITLPFSEDMADPAALSASFVLKVDGETAAVTSVALDSDISKIIVTPTTPIANGEVVTITIATKIIKSVAGAYFLGVTTGDITNNVPET